MFMRKMFLATIMWCVTHAGYSQEIVDLQENKPYQSNGLEYGFYITNEQTKEVKGDDYERYEVNLFVTNKSGCTRLIPFKAGSAGKTSDEEIVVAEFNCKNATGKRLTAKTGKISAKAWYSMVKLYDESHSSKYKLVNAQVGYAVRNGETLTTKIIVIVPKGERPELTCRTIYLSDL